ncbi:MAG: ABC transporter permease [Lachnospiraceae bacterium]|nr:ABC transporter permease [Lachnospiraceae bacterium]MCI9185373.1 ABC transporter permease [Lachnospiraceae bacterium]
MTFDAATMALLKTAVWETFYMVALSSFLAYVIGMPLGVILVVTDNDGIYPIPWLQKLLGLVINLLRSVPFLILLFIVLPLSKIVIGTRIGSPAIVIPLTIAAAPYIARVVESSFREVDAGVVEAAQSMGASVWQIIWKVLLPESRPSLLLGAALAVTTILSYSAMAGFTGGGGLGAVAINYGYYRYEPGLMWIAVILLVVMVQIIQELGTWLSKKGDKRVR